MTMHASGEDGDVPMESQDNAGLTADQDSAPILVTGASGCVGGHLARRLRCEGCRVRALVRPTAKTEALQAAGVELVIGDIRDAAAVDRAVAGVAQIYHIAGVFRTAGHPDSYYVDVNVGGTENVLQAARRHGVQRVVHCSTIGVHGDVLEIPCTEDSPVNPGDIYQRSKLEAEEKARAAFTDGLPGTIYRSASLYGPGDLRHLKLFRSIYHGRFRMFGNGRTLWHPIYIDDLIEGILLCGRHPAALGRTYILASAEYITLDELVTGIAEALGRPAPRGHLPYWPLYAAAVLCEGMCRPLRIDPPLHRRRVRFFVNNRAFSIERARIELGFEPKIGIGEGLRRTAAWYLEQGYLP